MQIVASSVIESYESQKVSRFFLIVNFIYILINSEGPKVATDANQAPMKLFLHQVSSRGHDVGRSLSQQRRLLARDVTERNSVLTNSYSLVYILHFVLAVTP